ncbi:glycosyl hydrolase-related protein [uncultured Sunxiuqinia sp.]|uniref:glycoside hydrolase family 38 N-terminal domain-containing protein n=1 Tax=uncultured Sunxiuqinia sp. TaxID=1573825 RepID=UPI00262D818B|nr:glycosyl hydrolase-related protein [uncultured Sunxiuqinia sp.]
MKLNHIVVTLIILLTGFQLKAQDDSLKKLATESSNWFEGFQKNIGGNEFTYHSFRNDVSASLITRCTDGEMGIEWETAVVPENWNKKSTGFLWIAAIDLTSNKHIFDVYVNGEKRFEITSSEQKNWKLETADGGTLSYITLETDHSNDAHGYMSMIAPTDWLRKGAAQTIKIEGRAHKDNTWIIVYQATDALSFLQNSIEYDVWMEIELRENAKKLTAQLKAPFTLAGKTLQYRSDKKTKTIQLSEKEGFAIGELTLPLSAKNKAFALNDPMGEVFKLDALGKDFKSTRLLAKAVLLNESKTYGGKTLMTARRNYKPNTVSDLLKLSKSSLGDGQILLMNSSHQDIAWMDSPEKCIIERDTMLLAPLFEMGQKDKSYRFDVEDVLMLKEFVERHPEKKELVRQMLADGRISCGSTYIQPYEEMYSGEALARQFYFGAKWLKDQFNYDATVYWNEDVPGRTPQMMQMMRKAGTKYMMISRHERGLFNWYSPDGSFVTTFTPGHYGNAFSALQRDFHESAQFLANSSLDWEKYYSLKTKSPVIPLLSDNDMSPAVDHSSLVRNWSNIKELQNEKGKYVPVQLPSIKIASAPEFFDALMAQKPKLGSISGERPNVWLYIHGPGHQKALKASREGDILLTMAEKFATANALVDGSFVNYPETELRNAWEAKIYPDHGWGGKQGDITDAYFHQKYEFAKAEALRIVDRSLNELAAKIKTESTMGRPLVVFNSMNTDRTDPVSIEVRFAKSQALGLQLQDAHGKEIDLQLINVKNYSDGSIQSATLNFIAEEVPSIGYKTFYLKNNTEELATQTLVFSPEVENRFYKLRFANGGLASIFDKELNQELVNSDKFVAGEIFTMHSEGNGAGEFIDVQKPDMLGFDKTGNYKTNWEIEESGAVSTTYKYRQKIRHAVVEQRIVVFNQQKRIDFETQILNWEGVLYREFRMALPLNMTDGQVAYEVPFGVVEVGEDEIEGAAGERYTTICKTIHPRGIENWISASNARFGVTLSSSVAVADWIDPTDKPLANQILQPILFASRRSCHWEGNEYLQTGNHSFKFSITSHKPGWENGANFGRAANETLKAVWVDHSYAGASLPESLSFFQINSENVLVSTVKKAEDSNDVVIRIAEMEGTDKTVDLESFKKISQAKTTNLIETEGERLPVQNNRLHLKLGHHAIETFKINYEIK